MVAKQVIPMAEAYSSATPPQRKAWRFVQTQGVGNPIRFPDKTEFTFRRILSNNGEGYLSQSSMETDDEGLAAKLRAYGEQFPGSVFEQP